MGKNVLVTGATGDIGSKICRKLFKAGVTHLCMFVRTEETFNAKSKKTLFSNQSVTQTHIEEIDFREPQRIEQKFAHAMKVHFKGKLDAIFLCHGVVVELNVSNCSTPDFD